MMRHIPDILDEGGDYHWASSLLEAGLPLRTLEALHNCRAELAGWRLVLTGLASNCPSRHASATEALRSYRLASSVEASPNLPTLAPIRLSMPL